MCNLSEDAGVDRDFTPAKDSESLFREAALEHCGIGFGGRVRKHANRNTEWQSFTEGQTCAL